MTTVWNSSDLSAVTLSNGNLTATPTGQGGVRSIFYANIGKYYLEYTFGGSGTTSSDGMGFANAGAGMASAVTNGVNVAFAGGNGNIVVNNTTVLGSIGAFAVGGVCCAAIDIGAQLVWFRNGAAGNWNGSGTANPATGTGGFSLSGLTAGPTPIYAYCGFSSSGGTPLTANFGASSFVGAVPSGFAAFGFPGVNTAIVTQSAVEQWSLPASRAQATQVAVEEWGLSGTVATQAVATQVALEQWALNLPVGGTVDLAGNLGGSSSFGKLGYGAKLYSRVQAFAPVFSADVTVSTGDFFAGNIGPLVTFGGALGVIVSVSGGLAPSVTFAADLVVIGFVDFAGGIAPSIALGGSLAVDVSLVALQGGLTINPVLEALSFTSGPLWGADAPCPAPPWQASEPCAGVWTASAPCAPAPWGASEKCRG